jgi:hypothetical protein
MLVLVKNNRSYLGEGYVRNDNFIQDRGSWLPSCAVVAVRCIHIRARVASVPRLTARNFCYRALSRGTSRRAGWAAMRIRSWIL